MPGSRYEETLEWLYALEAARGMDFKLERVERALTNLGDPQRSFRSIHVGGTNGKGSVAATADAILRAAGHRTGLYTSPHLVRFTERIRVAGDEVSEDQVVTLTDEIRRAATDRGIDLTFFELTTVLSFLHFARSSVDVAVVEVGLGGRLDATNVIDAEVAVITSIGMDHEDFLGNTIESIAAEKAGILKPGRTAVIGRLPATAMEIVDATATHRQTSLQRIDHDFRLEGGGGPGCFDGLGRIIHGIRPTLRGPYQWDNTAVAIAAVLALDPQAPVRDEAIRQGCVQTRCPGRLDVVSETPRVILDCAHNPDGMRALIQGLESIVVGGRIHLLFAVMRDKRWQEMVDLIGPRVSTATITSVMPPRGESPDRVASAMARHVAVDIEEDPIAALEAVIRRARPEDTVLVTGSLFLVGTVYPCFGPSIG